MNYKETMEYIEYVNGYGSVLGLDNIRNLLKCLGNPQDSLRFVHIAGTNGKGSTLAYISTVLKCAGYKVGRYISPTIVDYRERIQINGKMISKTDLASYMSRIKDAIEQLTQSGGAHPTAFEIETALSLLYFKEKSCEIVVLETGMGGLLDATNVIQNTVLAVFASISMDHMSFLGENLQKIAANKAGIIKSGCQAVSCEQKFEAMQMLQQACEEKGVPLTVAYASDVTKWKMGIRKQSFQYKNLKNVEISLAGTYQIKNATLALLALEKLKECGFQISDKALYKGMLETEWLGRFSVIADKPTFIVDGAHNEDAAKQLAESIAFYFTNKKIIYIMGILKDKEYDKIIRLTYSYADYIITVSSPHNKRAMPAYELAQEVRYYHEKVTAADSLEEAVEMGYLLADKDSVIIAFGSLSYLGELAGIVRDRNRNKEEIKRDSHGRSE